VFSLPGKPQYRRYHRRSIPEDTKMTNTAPAINTFLPEQKDNFVLPQEQQLITLSISDYRNIFIQIEKLNDRISALESHQTADIERLARDIALDRQRISRLETPKIQPSNEDSPLLDELYKEMQAQGRKQTDFSTAARMVKRSKRRIIQLKGAIALDQRFILIPSESHSQKLLIRLREYYRPV
jgi:hypothetical protein